LKDKIFKEADGDVQPKIIGEQLDNLPLIGLLRVLI
jgi:hypothetical protein